MALIDVIELPDQRAGDLVTRVPEQGAGQFTMGSQLIVREGQAAVFYRDGKALDVFGPGRYTISTNNLPILGGLTGAFVGGRKPFTAAAHFVRLRGATAPQRG